MLSRLFIFGFKLIPPADNSHSDDSLAPGPVLRKQFDSDFGGEVSVEPSTREIPP